MVKQKPLSGVVLLVLVLASCVSQASSTASSAAPPAGAPPAQAAKSAPKKSYTIGISLASATNPLYIRMGKGMQEKAEELGVKVRTVIANEDQTRQVNGIQDLITSKVDLLLISPISVAGATVAYENAKQANIPAISVARFLNKPDLEASIVSIDSVKDGTAIGEWMVKRLNGKGRIAMLKGPAGASFAMDLEKGFKQVVSKYPNIKIVGEVNSPLTKEDGLRHSENFLTANPQLDAIFSANDELALGAVQAAESAGRLNKIAITGYNGVPSAVESIRAGKLSMTVVLGAESWGQLAMKTAVDYLNGKQVAKQVFFQPIVVDGNNITKLKPDQLK